MELAKKTWFTGASIRHFLSFILLFLFYHWLFCFLLQGKSSRAGERWLCSDHSIRENFDQYGLDGGHFLGVALADSSRHDLWHFSVAHGLLDAIITDRIIKKLSDHF